LRFSNRNIVCISHLSHARYMPCSSHPPWFQHPNNFWNVQIMKLLIMQSSPVSRHSLHLGPNTPQHPQSVFVTVVCIYTYPAYIILLDLTTLTTDIENWVLILSCRGSSVGIATGYGLNERGLRVRFSARTGIFLFSTASRPALRPTQPPIQLAPGALSLGVKRPGHEADNSPPSNAEL
jgi:hypothetical protein